MRSSRLIAAVVAVALLATVSACSHDDKPDSARPSIDPASAAKVSKLRRLPFDADQVGVLADELAAAGVGITQDPTTPSGPTLQLQTVRLTGWQLQNMAAEAANGGGVRGDLLATTAPTPQGAPPLGYLIAAWATTYDSPGARFAYALLGERDFHRPEQIVFPNAVLTLFLADATKAAAADGASAASPAIGPAGQPVLAGGLAGPCTAVTNFVQRAIYSVANVLKVNASKGGFLGFLGKIWNAAVDLAAGLVKGLIETVTQPVVSLMANVFGVIATIEQVSTFLTVWRAVLSPDPEENRFGVDAEVVTGRVKLTISDNKLPISELILDCADAFGVDLREVGSAAGSKLAWAAINQGRPDLSSKKSADGELGKNQTADYTYATGQESAKLAAGGKEQERGGLLQLTASVQRNDIERVRRLFTKLVFDQIPAAVRDLVEAVAKPVLDLATRRLAALTDVKAVTYIGILYHADKQPTPTATTGGGKGLSCGPNDVAPGHYRLGRNKKDLGDGTSQQQILDLQVSSDGSVSGKVVTFTDAGPGGSIEVGWQIGGTVAAPMITKLVYTIDTPGIGKKDLGKNALSAPFAAGGPITGDCSNLTWSIPMPSQLIAMVPDQNDETKTLLTGWDVPRS
ncbi:hypothetical protein HDA40_006883 [Hamadaea flava]|uniref:Uncharacterized protein n=1 Tax=Hamadaea flava TaxID=1742688 RepID=A0ABV8LUC5_9ACTN|nr:hypothetical protein [Hamadaea flava]MCP2328376.1 hypothetical protein [Hamadaea flava]